MPENEINEDAPVYPSEKDLSFSLAVALVPQASVAEVWNLVHIFAGAVTKSRMFLFLSWLKFGKLISLWNNLSVFNMLSKTL